MNRPVHRTINRKTFIAALAISASLMASRAEGQVSTPVTRSIDLSVVPELQEIIDRVSADSILASLRELESLGVKAPGMQALIDAGNWLQTKYESYGYSDITRHGFDFQTHNLQNIIVTNPHISPGT